MKTIRQILMVMLTALMSTALYAQNTTEAQIVDYYNKGAAAYEAGNYPDAYAFFEKGLQAVEQQYGAADTLAAFFHEQAGLVCEALQTPKLAIQHYAQAAEIWKQEMGEESEQYVKVLLTIFTCSTTSNYLDDVNEPLLTTLMDIVKQLFGEQNPTYATMLINVAKFYEEMGNYEKAEPLLQQALEIRKKALGEQHPDYSTTLNSLAGLYWGMQNYEKAEHLYKEVIEIRKNTLGEQHTDYGVSIFNLAGLYNDMGNYKKAEPLYMQALEIYKKSFGEQHLFCAAPLGSLANLYYQTGNYAKSEPLYIQALEIRKKVLGEQHPEYAKTLNNLATLYDAMGNYKKAEPLFIQALNIIKKTLGELHPEYAKTLNNMATLYFRMGNYERAEWFCLQALEIYKTTQGDQQLSYAYCLNNLSEIYISMGYYDKAEPLYIQALNIMKKTLGEQHPDYATALNNLAKFYEEMGNYEKTELLVQQALEIRKKVFGEDHPDYATTITTLALLYYKIGNYEKVEPFLLQALEITKKTLGEQHSNYATSLNNIATYYYNMGDYKKAEPLYLHSLKINQKVLGKQHPDYAISLQHMAGFYYSVGKYEKAEPLLQKALEIQKKALGELHPSYATSLSKLAALYYSVGKYEKAEPLLQKALEIQKKALGELHPSYATSLSKLAALYYSVGKYEKAEPLLQKALEIQKKALGENHPDYSISLSNLAAFYQQTRNYTAAYPLFTRALQSYERQVAQNFGWLPEQQRELYYKTVGYKFEIFYSFTQQAQQTLPQTLADAYNYCLFFKGRQLAATLQMRNRIAQSADATLLQDYENWLNQRRQLGKLYEMTIAARDSLGWNIDSLETAANRAEAALARRSQDFARATDTTRYTWQMVQQQLKPGEAAVEIVRFRWAGKSWTDSVHYALMVVTPQTRQHPQVVWLNNGNDLEGNYYNQYKGALQRGENDFDSYLRYWQPLDSLLQGVHTIYLSADGIYLLLNPATLLTPQGKYLSEVINLRLTGSTRDLVRRQPSAAGAELTAVLVGNPQYGASAEQVSGAAQQFRSGAGAHDAYLPQNARSSTAQLPPLPGTKTEIDSIAAELQQQGYRINVYLGKDAVEEAVKTAHSPRVLHLATHGVFLPPPQQPRAARPQLLIGMETGRAIENPLLRAQLFFTGAQATLNNQYPPDAQYDNGILTAYEAVNLDLRGTDLVVLSACETGLGEVHNGEGVFGLQRAFYVAGSRCLLMSLWKVSDEATRLFMTTFYRQWQQTGSKQEGYRTAVNTLKATSAWKHPNYWGAFVLVGE
ncbi:hypothetical protein C7N43_35080 [Sphingobacteriales bacterium UPWRP_1]|nr:hypothetical protein C7N43_35080 [Sphingobacteriales bacterium UPWRP_1]